MEAVLSGGSDARGDKYFVLAPESDGVVAYWVGPVRNPDNRIVGAMLLGEPLVEVAARIRDTRASELIFYDPTGRTLSSSLPGLPALRQDVTHMVSTDHPVRITAADRGHSYRLLVSEVRMRDVSIGYLAVALNADALESSLWQLRLILVLLFAADGVLTLLLGSRLARHITRPLEQLVTSTRVVSAGDLNHRAAVTSRDEIGYLAQSFNEMTASLERKSAELEESYFASIQALARAIDARDPSTFGHSARVAAISLELARAMELPPAEQEAIRRAALLHDIGKIGVADRILRKPGRLNAQEFAAMRAHPVIGYEMLRDLRFLNDSLSGVRHHHERWDGSGYPDGLRREGIPLGVRVVSVADVLDALTSDRPERRGLSFEAATQIIREAAGTQFDPRVVAAFASRAKAIAAVLQAMGKDIHGEPDPMPTEVEWLQEAG